MEGQLLGFVGVGRMGGPMASRLLDAGYSLCVFDTNADAMAPLIARGSRSAASPADVASATATVLMSLPTPGVVQTVTLGERGIGRGSTVRTAIDLSTSGPGMSTIVAAGLSERGLRLVDAPGGGGVGGGSGRNSATQDKYPRSILKGRFDFGFATGLSYKDVRLCVDEAESMGVPMVVGAAVRQMLAVTQAKYGAASDFTCIAKVLEEWAGVQIRSSNS